MLRRASGQADEQLVVLLKTTALYQTMQNVQDAGALLVQVISFGADRITGLPESYVLAPQDALFTWSAEDLKARFPNASPQEISLLLDDFSSKEHPAAHEDQADCQAAESTSLQQLISENLSNFYSEATRLIQENRQQERELGGMETETSS